MTKKADESWLVRRVCHGADNRCMKQDGLEDGRGSLDGERTSESGVNDPHQT
jgi:hypothetical protein